MNFNIDLTVGRIGVMEKTELKNWRENLGLTQDELAKKLKVASNTVSRWELGERKTPEYLDLALKTIEREIKEKS